MNVLGLLLAGGRSTRMGQDKALLPVGNSDLMSYMAQKVQQAGVDKLVVSRNQNAPCNTSQNDSLTFLSDIIPNKGPLSGIYSAMQQYKPYNVMVLPIDLPLIKVSTLQQFIRFGEQQKSHACVVKNNLKSTEQNTSKSQLRDFPSFHFPLFIQNTEIARNTLQTQLLQTTNYSVFTFLNSHAYAQFKCSDENELLNANTQNDWLKIQKELVST